jgi:hypothetical protein
LLRGDAELAAGMPEVYIENASLGLIELKG